MRDAYPRLCHIAIDETHPARRPVPRGEGACAHRAKLTARASARRSEGGIRQAHGGRTGSEKERTSPQASVATAQDGERAHAGETGGADPGSGREDRDAHRSHAGRETGEARAARGPQACRERETKWKERASRAGEKGGQGREAEGQGKAVEETLSGRSLELDHATMQRIGRQVADFVAQHLAMLRDQPAYQTLDRQSARKLLGVDPPEHPSSFDAVLSEFRDRVVPHHAREPHPRFLGYIPSCPTFPAIMGDWLATGFNFFAGVGTVAAGPNEVELTVLEWFRRWMGMPPGTHGLLTSGGSAATITAVVAARHASVGASTEGLGRLSVYCSDQDRKSV